MEDKELDELQKEIDIKNQSNLPIIKNNDAKLETTVSNLYEDSVKNNEEACKSLADSIVKTQLETKQNQVKGYKDITNSRTKQKITEEKMKEDNLQSQRAETILKSQGITKQIPTLWRYTALGIGYPFFVIYLLTFGWILQVLTFVITGFITMVAECVDKFATLNKKFIDNENTKQFNLGRAITGILKWLLFIGAGILIVVLLLKK